MHPLGNWFILLTLINLTNCDHRSQREELMEKDSAMALGSSLDISEAEECVSDKLLHLKLDELDRGLSNSNNFYARTNFLKTSKYIDSSEVFKFIRRIPKGAALHLHDMAMASAKFLYKLTFAENLYVCWTSANRLLLNFFQFHVDNRCDWVLLEFAREAEGFEDLLISQLSLTTSIYRASTSNQVAWSELMGTFGTIEGLISYKPIFTYYLKAVLNEMYDDNVMYVELRTMLLPIYDLEGNDYSPADVARLLKDILEDFRCLHSDFLGGKIIYSPSRVVDQVWMDHYIEVVEELMLQHSDFLAGFDLMGEEELNYPLSRFVTSFQSMNSKVNFFFSAGETNWMGATGDLNLYDAILLHPKRIGHAFTIFTHPEILKVIRQDNIAIELCPISNQMMMLVEDLRNHPGKYLISRGYPVVVSSDNPGFWGARILSHDWYVVFMAMSDRMADLRLLKQLALNSIEYSMLSDRDHALAVWELQWNKFINETCPTKTHSTTDSSTSAETANTSTSSNEQTVQTATPKENVSQTETEEQGETEESEETEEPKETEEPGKTGESAQTEEPEKTGESAGPQEPEETQEAEKTVETAETRETEETNESGETQGLEGVTGTEETTEVEGVTESDETTGPEGQATASEETA